MSTTNQCERLMALAEAAEMCSPLPSQPTPSSEATPAAAKPKALAEGAMQTLRDLHPDTAPPPPEALSVTPVIEAPSVSPPPKAHPVSKGPTQRCRCEKCAESHGLDGKLVSLKTIKEHERSQKRRENGTSQAVKCERCLCRKEKDKRCIASGPGQPCDFCTTTKQSCSFVPKKKKRTPEHMAEATAETREPPSKRARTAEAAEEIREPPSKRARTAEAAAETQECPFRLTTSADAGPGVPSVPASRGFKAINRP
ncbi:hypothetical protein CMUS01_01647 [Colletotrichum musicola]|uniref:Uncharacterized protein n=1 Tax=Colletotrichum musicola TaxID=2175873 RepID=A0A8H6NWS2_9PEZI|nr:hypothetical protein CMUS01_01647 [Colletotrichum musicola]